MTLSLTILMSIHDGLDARFLDHQRALLHFDHKRAITALELYETDLLRHMQDEENVLLPVYSDRCDFPAVGAPKLYLDEHEKMRAHLVVLKDATAALTEAEDIERSVLRLLGHEAFYLRLCGHHDKREAEYLYPLLDGLLSEDEKRDLLDRVWRGSELTRTAKI